ncbi:MAG: GNAT family N-acetyltransferase [Alphaproteobacteria bacterium]|nr:GNAT family N-acetyltransferase [Alphaproteobacteria bacterium]
MPGSPVEIVWNEATVDDWRRLIGTVDGGTLPQSWAYAQAMPAVEGQIPHFGVIRDGSGELGCVLVLERRAMSVFSRISIHRGPLWLKPDPPLAATLVALRRRWPRRPWRRVSFIPELPAGADSHRLLVETGFRRAGDGYRSILVDLPARRERLRATWRHELQRSERRDLAVEIDRHGKATLPWLLQRCEIDRKLRGYRGPSNRLALQLVLGARVGSEALVLIASHGAERVAGILVIRHGDTATYLLGWTGAEGRRLGATHLLLWRAMEALAGDGAKRLDLGGINPEAAPGLTLFKRGLGGREYELIGTYT